MLSSPESPSKSSCWIWMSYGCSMDLETTPLLVPWLIFACLWSWICFYLTPTSYSLLRTTNWSYWRSRTIGNRYCHTIPNWTHLSSLCSRWSSRTRTSVRSSLVMIACWDVMPPNSWSGLCIRWFVYCIVPLLLFRRLNWFSIKKILIL